MANRRSNNADYMKSVLFSLMPVLTIYFLCWYTSLGFWLTAALFVAGNIIGYSSLSSAVYFRIYWRSALLFNVFLVGLLLLAHNETHPTLTTFGLYLMCLSFFHLSEFVFTALFNTNEASTDSFMLNHSLEYSMAACASWLEFALEAYFIPSAKMSVYTRVIGLALVVFGETFRKLAMYTAGTNFNHYVQETRQQGHILVTSGIYSLIRHPVSDLSTTACSI
jgi:protein-S-isoprenylcysteine O-methyltransferase